MIVGIVWPSPGPNAVLDPELLAKVRPAGVTHCRFDLDYRHPDPMALVDAVRVAGFEPLPILGFEYTHTPDLTQFVGSCERIVDLCELPLVEILNEPRIMGGWDGHHYGRVARAVCRQLQGMTRVIVAGDYLQPDRKGPQIYAQWFKDVRDELDDDRYQVVAWHTYREPAAPEVTRYASRADEYEAMRRPLPPGVPIQVTEVGWNLAGVSQQMQADYLVRELTINESLGIEATYIYAGLADPARDFGLLNLDLTPRPALYAVQDFQAARE